MYTTYLISNYVINQNVIGKKNYIDTKKLQNHFD